VAYVERAGVRLHYETVGTGFPLVLHTGAGGDAGMFAEAGYVDALDGFTRVLFDHRGHGSSSRPRELEAHRIEEYVADVLALGLDRFGFVGYSDGARVGYALAAANPERVAALVAIGTVDPRDGDPDEKRAAAREVREHGIGPLVAAMADEEGIEPPRWLVDQLVGTDPEMFALELEAWAEWSPWPLFPRIEAPTVIVAGELEDCGCAEAADLIPHGRAVVVPGLGHLGVFLRSDLVVAEARAIL
jgi:pimeloyl-ACP methyl ester carboxylesterase